MGTGGVDRRTFLLAGAGAVAAMATSTFSRIGSGEAPAAGGDVKSAGIRMLPVVGGKHRVWTKKVGSGPIKVLTLHGGPGLTHEYFECFEDFLPEAGVTFWYYDQLDSHYSDQPGDESLWTVGRYTEEVEEVRKGLGLTDFVLYGHSWGGMLAIEYALQHPEHLKAVVISDMTAGIKAYEAYVAELRRKLPPDVIAILDKYEAKGEYTAPEYEKTMFEKVYSRHSAGSTPGPSPSRGLSGTSTRRSTTFSRGPTSSSSPAASRTGSGGMTCRRSGFLPSFWWGGTTR